MIRKDATARAVLDVWPGEKRIDRPCNAFGHCHLVDLFKANRAGVLGDTGEAEGGDAVDRINELSRVNSQNLDLVGVIGRRQRCELVDGCCICVVHGGRRREFHPDRGLNVGLASGKLGSKCLDLVISKCKQAKPSDAEWLAVFK